METVRESALLCETKRVGRPRQISAVGTRITNISFAINMQKQVPLLRRIFRERESSLTRPISLLDVMSFCSPCRSVVPPMRGFESQSAQRSQCVLANTAKYSPLSLYTTLSYLIILEIRNNKVLRAGSLASLLIRRDEK